MHGYRERHSPRVYESFRVDKVDGNDLVVHRLYKKKIFFCLMSKKLGSEIEKCLKDLQVQLQTYDMKWCELKSYNEAQAAYLADSTGVVRSETPESVYFIPGGARPKRGIVVVDVSKMDEKEVHDIKEKLKSDLEVMMKRVYRVRQQLMEWMAHDSRPHGCSRELLLLAKREIEFRHRRGKVYYLRGVSSEDTTNEHLDQISDASLWIQEFIRILSFRDDEECKNHALKLDEILRGIRNNSFEDDSEHGETLVDRLKELKEVLQPLVDNEFLQPTEYIVSDKIYSSLGFCTLPQNNKSEIVPQSEVPPKRLSYRKIVTSSFNDTTDQEFPPLPCGPAPSGFEPRAPKQPSCSSSSIQGGVNTFSSAQTDISDYSALEDRVRDLKRKLYQPRWTISAELVLSKGVTGNICDVDLLKQLMPAVREKLLQQVECLVSSSDCNNSLPILVRDDEVEIAKAHHSWYGEMPGGKLITQRILQETSLLYIDTGNLIEVIANAAKDEWTYGRLISDKGRQGWFPSHLVAKSRKNWQ